MKKHVKYRILTLLLPLFLLLFTTETMAQQQNIAEGTVSDVFGNPIEGVRIISNTDTEIAVTDVLGGFQCSVPGSTEVWFKKEGYISQQQFLHIGNRNNFILKTNLINEQLSVGYGFQKRGEVISSVASVSEDVLSQISVSSPSYALYGLLPGLIVQEKAEIINGTAPNMFIRGRATYGNASNVPIVLVDGFERELDDIVLNDIKSVNVLKDAAATAIYGMKGANGVILVETKRGAIGRPRFQVNVEQGFQSPTRIAEFTNSADYAHYYNQALNNDGLPLRYSAEQITGGSKGNSVYYPDNQWQDMMIKSMVPTTKVNLSATGGSKLVKYYASLGYERHNGYFNYTKYMDYNSNPASDRYSFRTNLDVTAIANLDIKFDISGQIEEKNLGNRDQSSVWNLIYKYPQNEFPAFLPDGSLGGTAAFPVNPIGDMQRTGYRKTSTRAIQSSIRAEYHLQGALRGGSFGVNYAYDSRWNANEYWTKGFAVQEIVGQNEDGSPILATVGTDGKLSYRHNNNDDSQRRRENLEVFAKYNKHIAGHHLGAMFIYHQDQLNIDQNNPYNNQYWAGRFNYAYDAKYLAELVFSYSGSEAFAKKHRYEFYPAVALGWVMSKEDFMKDIKFIDFLKFRTSAGLSGNSDMGSDRFTYRQMTSYMDNNYYFGENVKGYAGRKLGTLANPDLKAEKSFKYEFGVEAQLFNSLYVAANYFFERRYDILTYQGGLLPALSGISYPNINAGVAHNQGIEIQLNYNKEIDKDWTLFGNLNFLTYTNKIKAMLETPLPDNSTYQYHTGRGIGQELALIAEGIFQSEDEILKSPTQQFGVVRPGDIKYKDVNNDGIIDNYDRVYTNGSNLPTTELGLNIGAKYKDFDISAFFHAQLGSEIYLGDAEFIVWPFNNSSYRMSQWVADRIPWSVETASIANFPRLSTIENSNNYRRSTYWIVNGDRLRLRNLEIGYTLPSVIANKLFMSSCRFYVRGTNLFTLDHIGFLDPVAMAGSPMLRSYYVGCNIRF